MKLIETTLEKIVIEFSMEEFRTLFLTMLHAPSSLDQTDLNSIDLTEEQIDLVSNDLGRILEESNKKLSP